jgi:hypothetical protein
MPDDKPESTMQIIGDAVRYGSDTEDKVDVYRSAEQHQSDQIKPLTVARPSAIQRGEQCYSSGEVLRMGTDNSLDKFRALNINGVSLTEATIGGYRLDLEQIVVKAREVIPLPPVALPLIFCDTDLNFSHHFFQGLERIAGRAFILKLASSQKYYAKELPLFGRLIKQLIATGYQVGDDDLVVFVKRVISVTFTLLKGSESGETEDIFLVQTNFYGFQYIEGGMQCREQDLRMWLQSAYQHYRLTWFNVFKSSGVPDFALHGVQDRYESTIMPSPENPDCLPTTGKSDERGKSKSSNHRHHAKLGQKNRSSDHSKGGHFKGTRFF